MKSPGLRLFVRATEWHLNSKCRFTSTGSSTAFESEWEKERQLIFPAKGFGAQKASLTLSAAFETNCFFFFFVVVVVLPFQLLLGIDVFCPRFSLFRGNKSTKQKAGAPFGCGGDSTPVSTTCRHPENG